MGNGKDGMMDRSMDIELPFMIHSYKAREIGNGQWEDEMIGRSMDCELPFTFLLPGSRK